MNSKGNWPSAIASIGFILKEAEFTFPGILVNQFGVLAIVWPEGG